MRILERLIEQLARRPGLIGRASKAVEKTLNRERLFARLMRARLQYVFGREERED